MQKIVGAMILLLGMAPAAFAQALPAPAPVQVDPAHTALLVLDMAGADDPSRGPCNATTKPRCIASLPYVAGLLAAARAHGALVVFSVTTKGRPSDISNALTPQAAEPVVQAGPDKFIGTKLADILAAHRITRVVITGTAAEGAVLDTAIDAILRDKLDVVLPVDGISSTTPYAEHYVAYDLIHAPGLAGHAVLTNCATIDF